MLKKKLYKNVNGVVRELTTEEYEEIEKRQAENEYKMLDMARKEKESEAQNILEQAIYKVYPEHKQRNLGICGTNEERQEFKKFKDNLTNQYKKHLENIEEMNNYDTIKNYEIIYTTKKSILDD